MQLIHSNEKNTRRISCAKARIENQTQSQTESEKIIETKRENSHNNETNWKIYVQTLQTLDQIR